LHVTTTKRRFTVALVGPDGAGKTTVGRRLESELPMRARYLYMGVNQDASNRMLPTTRLVRMIKRARGAERDVGGPPDPSRLTAPRPTQLRRRILARARAGARLTNRLAEEWYRQLLASWYVRRGEIVIFDRHFFSDYYAHDVAGEPELSLSRRIHGLVLSHLYPKPDLVVFLDAPAEILLARKGEGTLETLSRRRDEYRQLAPLTKHFVTVDATRPVDEVSREVVQHVRAFADGGFGDERRG
jgi:thymidylate kinase